MFHDAFPFFSRLNPKWRRAGASILLLCAGAHAQTWYWNPSAPFLNGGGEIHKSNNWTFQQNGGGAWAKSATDDDFTLDALNAKWTFVSTDNPSVLYSTAGDQLSLTGKGADVWLTDNQFTAVYRKDLTGDFDVSVKVVSQANVDPWTKSGILVFNDFTQPGKGGAFAVIVTPSNGIKIQYDSTGGVGEFDAPAGSGAGPNPMAFPVWLRATRKNGSFTGWYRTALNNAWTPIRTVTPQSVDANSQVGLFATSHNTGSAATAVFDDFQAGSGIQANNLNLSFNGSSSTADSNANLTASFTAQNLDLTGYAGRLSFGSSTLTLSGNAEFSTTAKLDAGTGTLAFNASGTQIQTLSPLSGGVLPNIAKSGTGTLQILTRSLSAGVLNMQAGTFDLNGRICTFAGLSSSGGSFKTTGAADSLIFTGDADFSGITALPAGGTVQIRSASTAAGPKTVQFTAGNAAFPNLCLWSFPSSTAATIKVGGTVQVKGVLTLRDEKTTGGALGILDFKTGNANVSVDGDLLRSENGAAGGTGTQQLLMGNGTWTAKGNVSVSFANGGDAGASTLDLAAAAPVKQTLAASNGGLGNVRHSGTGTLVLGANLNGSGLAQSAGILDFNGSNVSVSGDIAVSNGTATSLANLGGRTLSADGNIALTGQAGNLLNLNPAAKWTVYAGGTLNADYASIANSDATGPQNGQATADCVEGAANTRWTFVRIPAAFVRQPEDTAVVAGQKAAFTAKASGAPSPSYAWRMRGDTAVLSRDTVYTINAANAAANGAKYYCTIDNGFGGVESRDAILTVNEPPSVDVEPKDSAVVVGSPVSFSVTAKGTPPFTYEWRKTGDTAVVDTGAVLRIAPTLASQDGSSWSCTIASPYGSAATRKAVLSLRFPPAIAMQPKDTAVAAGTKARFSVSGTGTGPLRFAWHRSGDTATLARDSILEIAAVLADDSAAFFCEVSNDYGVAVTREARLTAAQAVKIVREPADITTWPGHRAVFSVSAIGAPPLAFKWTRKGDTATLSTDSIYAIDSVKMQNDGSVFTVTVSNGYSSAAGREARLTVVVCDSVFKVEPESLTVDEGQPISIKGTADCAESYAWNAESGPAPRILDPEVLALNASAPRVLGDSAIVYSFNAVYGANTASRKVTVKVREAIPDPSVALPAKPAWNGAMPLVLRPALANEAALKAAAYHPALVFRWFLSEEIADTAADADSLVLSKPARDGILDVTLCADNGGKVNCAASQVQISRAPTGLAGFVLPGGKLRLEGSTLRWLSDGSVRIRDARGRLLLEARGRAGDVSGIAGDALRALSRRRAWLEFRP
jgi:hypothetical protein